MSLKVWLPLDGTLDNNGTMNVTVTNTGATINTKGKIGQCYDFNGNALHIAPALYNNYTRQFTIACWFKVNAFDNVQTILCNRNNFIGAEIDLYIQSATTVYCDGGYRWVVTVPELQTDTWYHIAYTYDKDDKRYLYLNGGLIGSYNTTDDFVNMEAVNFTSIGASPSGSNPLNGSLNDLRLYDHCLSAAEVKEIAQGLMLHYKLDNQGLGGRNLLLKTEAPRSVTLSDTSGYTARYYFDTDCDTFVQKDGVLTISYNYKVEEVTTDDASIYTQINDSAVQPRDTYYFGDKTTGYHTATFVVTENQANFASSFRFRFRLYNANAGASLTVWNVKLEVGETATPYSPAWSELSGYDSSFVPDSSGYNHHGLAVNDPKWVSDSSKYGASLQFNSENQQYVRAYRYGMPSDQITVSVWALCDDAWMQTSSKNLYSCTQAGGYTMSTYNNGINFCIHAGLSSYTYYRAISPDRDFKDLLAGWHHFVGTYDGIYTKLYIDGALEASSNHSTPAYPIHYHANNGLFLGAEAYTTTTTPTTPYYSGQLSDFRVYATALSADDVRRLYETTAWIDNKGGIGTRLLYENDGYKMTKTGILKAENINESDVFEYLKYDKNIYIEPDGSTWLRIYHQNSPAENGVFNTTDDMANSVYLNEHKWFNVEVCNHLSSWELMVKGKLTVDDKEWKVRWVQAVNPMTATYNDVAVNKVTKIINDEYQSSPSNFGGLYAKKATNQAYLTANNGSSSNWYGAIGAYRLYNNGIPGWSAENSFVTTTGYNDLYVRIDNALENSLITARIIKNKVMLGRNFREE